MSCLKYGDCSEYLQFDFKCFILIKLTARAFYAPFTLGFNMRLG